jgi:hypothetical protein
VPYLDLASYEALQKKRKTAPIGISVDSLSYKTARTLTLGKNQNGAVLHVFIKDGVLHAHEYLEMPGKFPGTDYITVSFHSGSILAAVLCPSSYAIPKATDTEFAELMLRFGYPLDFAEWNSSVNNPDENISGYFGIIFRME